jgi:hypothetical protein
MSGYYISQNRFAKNKEHVFDYRLTDEAAKIVQRLFADFPTIESGFEFGVGINTGFIREDLVAPKKVDGRYHPMVPGSGIARYGAVTTNGWIMYDKEFVKKKGKLGRTLPNEKFLSSTKILVVRTRNLSLSRRIIATIDDSKAYNLNRLSNIISRKGFNLYGLLGLLNSKLFNWLFSTRFYDYEIKPNYLRICPLADCNNQKLISAVQQILTLNKSTTRRNLPPTQLSQIQRQIDATDREIDRLVYELYGLTEEEIKIVEGGT